MTDDRFTRFPLCLYDSTARTKRNWKKLAKEVWRTGDWDAVLSDQPTVPLAEVAGPIIACNQSGALAWKSQEPVWQLNWVADVETPLGDQYVLREKPDLHFRLVLSGMRYLWFTIGMLSNNYAGLFFTYCAGSMEKHGNDWLLAEQAKRDTLRPWLAAYVAWLPELLGLRGQIMDASRGLGLRQHDVFGMFFRIANGLGLAQLTDVQRSRLMNVTEALDALRALHVIEDRDGRFAVPAVVQT